MALAARGGFARKPSISDEYIEVTCLGVATKDIEPALRFNHPSEESSRSVNDEPDGIVAEANVASVRCEDG